jgi:hypothetical protein
VRQDTKLKEGNVQITVREALPGQLRAWTELWSMLLAPVQTEHSTIVAKAAMEPQDCPQPAGPNRLLQRCRNAPKKKAPMSICNLQHNSASCEALHIWYMEADAPIQPQNSNASEGCTTSEAS